jgi:hypothetical protein
MVRNDSGSAAALDTGLLSICLSSLFGSLNGAAICDAENVSLDVFREVATLPTPVFGNVLSRSVDMIVAGDGSPGNAVHFSRFRTAVSTEHSRKAG